MEYLDVDAITEADIDAAIDEVLATTSDSLSKDLEKIIRHALKSLKTKTDKLARGQDGHYDVSITLNFGNQGQRYGSKKSVKIYAQYDGEEAIETEFDLDLD